MGKHNRDARPADVLPLRRRVTPLYESGRALPDWYRVGRWRDSSVTARLLACEGMNRDLRPTLGAHGEQLAADHLVRRGYTIVERNFRNRWGELDIVALDQDTLVFCEVKTLRATAAGRIPLDAVRGKKRLQVRRMAARWLVERPDHPRARELRFDAVGVTVDASGRLLALDHLEGAF